MSGEMADSWSTTEICTTNHTHCWTVKGFSQCDVRYLETTVKVNQPQQQPSGSQSPVNEPLSFRIRLHPQGNKDSNKDFTFFQVFCNTVTMKYRAKFTVYNGKDEDVPTTVYTGQQQLHGYFEYIRRDALLAHLQPSDELKLNLTLVITYDTVTTSSQHAPTIVEPEPRLVDVAGDFQALYDDMTTHQHLCDFVIVCDSTDLPCHMAVLCARSQYFAGLLNAHTKEFADKRVVLDLVDLETMRQLLYFMYSGTAPGLSEMAPSLLAAADRFMLPALKDMADQMMRTQLHAEGVCRDLILADQHNATELRAECMSFIAEHAQDIIRTTGWTEMRGHALLDEVLISINNKSLPVSARQSLQPPIPSVSQSTSQGARQGPSGSKRSRLSALAQKSSVGAVDMDIM